MRRFLSVCLCSALLASPLLAQRYETIPISLGMRIATVRYTEVGIPSKGLVPVFQGNLMGFVDYNGEQVVAPTYEKDSPATSYRFHDGRMKVKRTGLYGFINNKAEEVIPCQYEDATNFNGSLVAVKKNGLWGYLNAENEQIVPFGYKKVFPYANGLAAVVNEADSIGFVNEYGLLTIPFVFDNEGSPAFNDKGLCKIRKDGVWCYIDRTGENLGNDEQKALAALTERLAATDTTPAQDSTKAAIPTEPTPTEKVKDLDELRKLTAKKIYIQAEAPYESISEFKDEFAIVCKKTSGRAKTYGVISITDGVFSKEGKEIIPCEFDNVEGPFHGATDYFIVEKSSKYGAYKTDGTPLLPCDYQKVGKEGSELILIQQNDKTGFADATGKVAIPCKFEDARPFNAAYTAVSERQKEELVWNFIDKTGKVVATPEYEDASTFQNGVCPIMRKGKWGFVGLDLDEFAYKYEYTFSDDEERWSYRRSAANDPIPVAKAGKYGYINRQGKEIVKCQYEDAFAFVDGAARVMKGGKYGLIDKTGAQVLPTVYDAMEYDFAHNALTVVKGGKRGLVVSGKLILPCEYTSIKMLDVEGEKSDRLCIVEKNGLSGIFNLDGGKFVADCKYKSIAVSDGIFVMNGGETYLTIKGATVPAETLAAFASAQEKDGKWRIVDHSGKALSAYIFDQVGDFENGLAPVKIVNRWGVVDKHAKIVVPCIYEDVKILDNGVISIRVLAKRGLIDQRGEQILPKSGASKKVEWISTDEATMKVEER